MNVNFASFIIHTGARRRGDTMAKRITITAMFLCFCILLAAGDAAAFVDLGFSKDGRTYMFAQYGSTDKTWRGFAEIYSVDIEKTIIPTAAVLKLRLRQKPKESTAACCTNASLNKMPPT